MAKEPYKKQVERLTVPAIIHNKNYFYISMPVLADGTIDCWEQISLDSLPRKLATGWLVTSIPQGEEICIHGLGDFTIMSGEWNFTPETYADYIREFVQQMNNNPREQFLKPQEETSNNPTNDLSTYLFHRLNNSWQLTSLTARSDSFLCLEATSQMLTMAEIETMFLTGILASGIEGEFTLSLPGFADLSVFAADQTESADKLVEIRDLLAEATGQKTSLDICQSFYQQYLVDPTEQNRELLRQAYENVPAHERMFLGDMDTKDRDYLRILEI